MFLIIHVVTNYSLSYELPFGSKLAMKLKVDLRVANTTLFDTTIAEAISVAWEMLTLMPPAVLCTPEKFSESWHEVVSKPCDNGSYYKLTYYRPLMLYCAHGPVAVKAIVGKKVSSQRTVNIERGFEKGCTGKKIFK